MQIRRLNDNGLGEFELYIQQLKEGGTPPDPKWILEDSRTSESEPMPVELDNLDFFNRYELGKYLCEKFAGHDMQPYIGDRGFWSWIALFWFDQLCPEKDGKRSPYMHYNYVLSRDYRHRPRHAIYMTWQLVDRYGEDARFLLSKKVSMRGDAIEQMMGRKDFLSLDGVMRLAGQLYSDPKTGGFKKGTTSRKRGGSITRYVAWLQQLENTYDLYLATADDLKVLLPGEFQDFLKV